MFGTVTVTRIAYRALGASNLHPMDAALNLPVERASFGLRRPAAIEAVRGSFDDAKAAIERATGTQIGKRQIEQLTERVAVDIEAYYRAQTPAACTDQTLLVASLDGKGIVMCSEHLREATLKAASVKGGNAMRTRLATCEKNGRKRMAMLGVGHRQHSDRHLRRLRPGRAARPRPPAHLDRPGRRRPCADRADPDRSRRTRRPHPHCLRLHPVD